MLEIFIRGGEFFDPGSGTFLQVKDQTLKLGVEMAQGIFGEGAEDSGGVH